MLLNSISNMTGSHNTGSQQPMVSPWSKILVNRRRKTVETLFFSFLFYNFFKKKSRNTSWHLGLQITVDFLSHSKDSKAGRSKM